MAVTERVIGFVVLVADQVTVCGPVNVKVTGLEVALLKKPVAAAFARTKQRVLDDEEIAPVELFKVHAALANTSEYVMAPPPVVEAAAFGVIVPPLNVIVVLVGAQVTV